MIKNFFEFHKCKKTSLGEDIESLLDGGEISTEQKRHIMETIIKTALLGWESRSGRNIDANVRLANAIDNVIDDSDRLDLKSALKSYLNHGVLEKDPKVSAKTDYINESILAGKGVYHSFLKTLTALGQKDKMVATEECPDNFLIFQAFEGLKSDVVTQVFKRFRSLDNLLSGSGEISLYMGITCDGKLEYGTGLENRIPFGRFTLNKTALKWISEMESKSIKALKREINGLTIPEIMLLGKIKTDMLTYLPGNLEGGKTSRLKDGILRFVYQEVGGWDNNQLDEGELENIKSNFLTWLMCKKWSDKVLVSIKPGILCVYIYVKPK